MASGLPTPDLPEGEIGFICKPIFVPDIPSLWVALYGQIAEMTKAYYWKQAGTMTPEQAAYLWSRALGQSKLDDFCAEASAENCVEYLPSASFINYEPMVYPFTGAIPSGYLQPPFFEFSEILPSLIPDFIENWLIDASGWTGYLPTDILTATWAFPFFSNWFNDLAGGLPRFTVNVQGQGSVLLELISVPVGGRAIIAVDVEPNPVDVLNGILSGDIFIVELERDFSAAPPETNVTNTIEIPLTDNQPHFIHVTFVPTINPDFLPLQFGGGLRKVTLCGVIPIGDTTMNCQDVLDCISQEPPSSISVQAVDQQALSANVDNILIFDSPLPETRYTWQEGYFELVSNNQIRWLGAEPVRAHISGTADLNSATASAKYLKIVDSLGAVLSQELQVATTRAQFSINTDYTFQPNDSVFLVAVTATAGTTITSLTNTKLSAHTLQERGATGAQGLQGNTGDTGATAAVPPEIEYMFVNNMRTNTDAWLDELAQPFDGSPQSIDADIPAGNPDATQELALCKAIAAWVNLYAENKLTQIRGASFLHQAWDALLDTIQDTLGAIDNVLGWSIGSAIFGCFIDMSSARVALEDVSHRNAVICCLYDELKDISLTTTSFAAAIAACLSSLTNQPHDIICMIDNDLTTEHEVLFYYLYGRALEGNVNALCPCQDTYSYIEYDFTVSNHGWQAVTGSYINGVGFEGEEQDPDADDFSHMVLIIQKDFTSPLPKEVAAGMWWDSISDCGIVGYQITFYWQGQPIQAMGVGNNGTYTDAKRTWANSTFVTEGKLVDRMEISMTSKRCNGQPALARFKKARVWLDVDSPLVGTPSATAPLGTNPNGTTDPQWWE